MYRHTWKEVWKGMFETRTNSVETQERSVKTQEREIEGTPYSELCSRAFLEELQGNQGSAEEGKETQERPQKTFKDQWRPSRHREVFKGLIEPLKSIFGSLWRSQNPFLDHFEGPKIYFWITSKVPKSIFGPLRRSQKPCLEHFECPKIQFRISVKVQKSIFG